MGGRRYGGGGREYIPIATLSPPEWPALRWAAMRAILMFHHLWGTKSQDSVHRPQLLKRKEGRSGFEPRSFRLPAYRLTARPNRLSIRVQSLFISLRRIGCGTTRKPWGDRNGIKRDPVRMLEDKIGRDTSRFLSDYIKVPVKQPEVRVTKMATAVTRRYEYQ